MTEPKMPDPISKWMSDQMWGMHHLVWHLARRWDISDAESHAYVTNNGGSRANCAIEDHDRGQGPAIESRPLHQGSDDLEMLRRPIRFHEYTL